MYYLLEASESLTENISNTLHYCVDFSAFGKFELVTYGVISGMAAFIFYELSQLLFTKENVEFVRNLFLRILHSFTNRHGSSPN